MRRIPYAEVAEIVAEHPTRYAPIVADRFGVPITTVHRWVYVGRLRGVIPQVGDRSCPHCGGTGVVRYGPRKAASA